MTRFLTSKYISVGVTYISWFSDFALYLEYYLLDKCHTWDISSLWPDYWRQNISLLVWPIFHGSVILPYILNTICWINVTPGILLPCDPMNDHTISRSLRPIFHGSVILPYILNTICWINVTPGILVPCDPIIDVKIYLCWCDLYFMVQWFCLISWILFVGLLDISSMWPNEWPLTISRSLWPIFQHSVILPFIFITISWRIVIPGLLYLCDKMIYIQIHLGQCDLYYMAEW